MKNTRRFPSKYLFFLCALVVVACFHATASGQEPDQAQIGVQNQTNAFFKLAVDPLAKVLFYPLGGQQGIPLIVLTLFAGGVFFTLRLGFVNVLLFRHAFAVVRGRFGEGKHGELTHFQALTSALAGTVGLGNIAGVAVAISAGGPGAIFWMWMTAFLGMSLKFSSCALAHKYRRVSSDDHVVGGPMVYLKEGIGQSFPRLAWLGASLGTLFAILTICAALGAGNMFQMHQTYAAISSTFELHEHVGARLVVAIVLSCFLAVVIIGGIKRIGKITARMVPIMCLGYVGLCFCVLLANFTELPSCLISIVTEAFSLKAGFGGMMGVAILGIKRAAFSNEAGLGSAAIMHATAKTDEPIRQGAVAMLGPFVDTIVVCTMTALVILVTDSGISVGEEVEGITLTARAFASVSPVLPFVLTAFVCVFAYSSIVSWCYYGEISAEFLFGKAVIIPYRIVFVLIALFGPFLELARVIDLSDMLLLSMAFPNIVGMILISGKLVSSKNAYIKSLSSGDVAPEIMRGQ